MFFFDVLQTMRDFLSQYSRTFRDRFPHVQFETCGNQVPFCAYPVRITSVVLRTAGFFCVICAEVCGDATAAQRYNCCEASWKTAGIVAMRHLACRRSNSVPPSDPKRLRGIKSDPVSHSFSTGFFCSDAAVYMAANEFDKSDCVMRAELRRLNDFRSWWTEPCDAMGMGAKTQPL